MGWFKRFLTSAIGRKFLVGLSGLFLVVFLLIHLIGNTTLYWGPEAMNGYVEHLHEISLLPVVELLLALGFIVHILLVVWLHFGNLSARGNDRYAVSKTKRDDAFAALASKWMIWTGLVVLIFLIVHLGDFRAHAEEIEHATGGMGAAVVAALKVPWRAILYAVGGVTVAFHVFHGMQSAFRSIGFYNPKYTSFIEKTGVAFAVLVGLGFASIALLQLAR